jgi:membrane-bound serine protease (ClpP class)
MPRNFFRSKGFSLLLAVLAVAAAAAGEEEPSAADAPTPLVFHAQVQSIIQPVVAEFLKDGLAEADAAGAVAFVLELDTPGGLLTSTREISTAMLGAATPVVVYVAPSGAQAASAGFFLLMAADVAAMAPGTNTGAAHPVANEGKDIEGHLGEKVEQDAAATIRSLAERNGRDPKLAESAVMESRSFTEREAMEAGLVDLVADDLSSLLEQLEGREVRIGKGETRLLRTTGAEIRVQEMTIFQRVLSAIAHPNIAYLLLTLGGLGLYFELSTPGAILPGVLGAICLVLAFFALSVLPVNAAGIALLILAALFFIAEIKVTSYGLLTVGGIIALVLGSSMLFESPDPAVRVSVSVIVSVALFAALLVGVLLTLVVRTHRTQVATGAEGMVRKQAVARTELAPRGKVFVHGELWDAVSEAPAAVGQAVEVVAVEGMTLRVRPLSQGRI